MRRSALDLDLKIAFGPFSLELREALSLEGITALFGHSGCGKSTLLRILSGLERGASGRVRFENETWQDTAAGAFVAPHRRGVGYVFQDARLFDHLDVAGNLRFAERRSRAVARHPDFDDVVAALDLKPLLNHRAEALSGGERQRVAIGRALLSRPRLLLLDEPLSALDGRRKGDILPYIAELPRRFGLPIVYVTHAVDEVAQLARDMIVLSEGRVAARGPVGQVLERLDLGPLTGRFEAGVVLEAQVVGHDRTFHLTKLDFRGQRLLIPLIEQEVGQSVRLRLRARDVSLAVEAPSGLSIRNVLKGTVARIAEELETAYAEVLVDVAGGGVRSRITRLALHELELTVGMPVHVLVKSIAIDRPTPEIAGGAEQAWG